ncbi:MAG: 1-acyl-sn-glycerol-3-phosphate acyltransferase [Methylococcaceae bacterium]|nr:1-acyl-sn-glycerol-3-phosphate acyltransferase [Methylococcaceae bacterium]
MNKPSNLNREKTLRVYLGSALLFVCIFSSATVIGILILLALPFSLKVRYELGAAWCSLVVWMSKFFCGIDYVVEGREHIDLNQPAIVLCKHQSAWETLALRTILPMQTTLLKKSLQWFPIWGWALAASDSIAIDRKNQREAMRILLTKGTDCLQRGLWVVIFPEGTRIEPKAETKFSAGGAMLAHKSGYPVIPVALNAGTYWPRYSFLKYPGTITVRIGPPIISRGRKAADINAEAEAWVAQAMHELEYNKQYAEGS